MTEVSTFPRRTSIEDALALPGTLPHTSCCEAISWLEAENNFFQDKAKSILPQGDEWDVSALAYQLARQHFVRSSDERHGVWMDSSGSGLAIVVLPLKSDPDKVDYLVIAPSSRGARYLGRAESFDAAVACTRSYDLVGEFRPFINQPGPQQWEERILLMPGEGVRLGLARNRWAIVRPKDGSWNLIHLETGLTINDTKALTSRNDAAFLAEHLENNPLFEDLSLANAPDWLAKNQSLLSEEISKIYETLRQKRLDSAHEHRDNHRQDDNVLFSSGISSIDSIKKDFMNTINDIEQKIGFKFQKRQIFNDFVAMAAAAIERNILPRHSERGARLEKTYMDIVSKYGGPPPSEVSLLPPAPRQEVKTYLARKPSWKQSVLDRDRWLNLMKAAEKTGDVKAQLDAARQAAIAYGASVELQPVTQMGKLLSLTALALERGEGQDFLGPIYMDIGSNEAYGQFFTPPALANLMARLTSPSEEEFKSQFSPQNPCIIYEPCCGSGTIVLAQANSIRERGGNNSALFVGQDIDPHCARMCYLQMSLLGINGIAIVGNSLGQEQEDVSFTPALLSNPPLRIKAENTLRQKNASDPDKPALDWGFNEMYSLGEGASAVVAAQTIVSLGATCSSTDEFASSLRDVACHPDRGNIYKQYARGLETGRLDPSSLLATNENVPDQATQLRDSYRKAATAEEWAWQALQNERSALIENMRERGVASVTAQKWLTMVEGALGSRVGLNEKQRHALRFVEENCGPDRAARWMEAARTFSARSDEAFRSALALSDGVGPKTRISEEARSSLGEVRRQVLSVANRINPTVDIRLVRELWGEGQALMASGTSSPERREVAGMYQPKYHLATISLTPRFDTLDTAFHETWHSLERVLTPSERKTLRRAFPDRGANTSDERVAAAFAQWAARRYRAGQEPGKPLSQTDREVPPGTATIFRRVAGFSGALSKISPDFETVFRKAYEGELANRSLTVAREAAKTNPAMRRGGIVSL